MSKWRTTLVEKDAVLVDYRVNPNESTARILVREFPGIDKAVVDTIKTDLDADTTVTDPKADNQEYPGTWRINQNVVKMNMSGDLAGSASIIQTLADNFSDSCTATNKFLVRIQSRVHEQRENSWMYYERMEKSDSHKWINLSSTAATASYDFLHKILPTSGTSKSTVDADRTNANYYYNSAILYVDVAYAGLTEGKYYEITSVVGGVTYEELTDPKIDAALLEQEQDKSFTLYRTLKTLTAPALMRTRGIQYAGMIVTAETPTQGNSTIAIEGFNNATEKVYIHAKFRIGHQTYRLMATSTASSGAVTLNIKPNIIADTEDRGDNEQVYFFAAGD